MSCFEVWWMNPPGESTLHEQQITVHPSVERFGHCLQKINSWKTNFPHQQVPTAILQHVQRCQIERKIIPGSDPVNCVPTLNDISGHVHHMLSPMIGKLDVDCYNPSEEALRYAAVVDSLCRFILHKHSDIHGNDLKIIMHLQQQAYLTLSYTVVQPPEYIDLTILTDL